MNLRALRALYVHEIRSALRERNIVVYTLLIPAVLYPLLLWLAWTALTFVTGQTEGLVSRVAVTGVPPEHAALVRDLDAEESISIIDIPTAGADTLQKGAADAVLECKTAGGAEAAPIEFRLLYDGSREQSEMAKERVTAAVDRYRERWLSGEARARGVPAEAWAGVRIEARSTTTGEEMGVFLMKLIVPMLLVLMTATGCFYPAIDTTAGERERSTWETLLSSAPSRGTLILAKYLYVATFGFVAALLNLVAILTLLTAGFGQAPGRAGAGLGATFRMPLAALPVMGVTTALLALFTAAITMLLASFARTFKQGQAMLSPFYLAIAFPALLVQSPDVELTAATALLPIVNVTLIFRDSLSGVLKWPLIALAAAAQVIAIGLAIALASWVTRFEDVMTGSFRGGLGKLLKERLLKRPGRSRTGDDTTSGKKKEGSP